MKLQIMLSEPALGKEDIQPEKGNFLNDLKDSITLTLNFELCSFKLNKIKLLALNKTKQNEGSTMRSVLTVVTRKEPPFKIVRNTGRF